MTRKPWSAPRCATRVTDGDTKPPANDNAPGPIVILTPIGDGTALVRALARVLVRRELMLTNAIPGPIHCKDERRAG